MATVTAIGFNVFAKIGIVRPRIEVVARKPVECTIPRKPLRMQWVREVDSNGRMILRIQWVRDVS